MTTKTTDTGKYLTVVYRDISAGDEAKEIIAHPKMSAASWSHALIQRDDLLNQRDDLLAALRVLVKNGGIGPEEMFDDAIAAIAKAEGGAA